jgi:hypothetical protein
MNVWGGSAAGGGLNFQACVSAIAAVHLARGTPIGWLKDVTADIPIFLLAETGGPGDDIRLEFQDGSVAEIQAKRKIRIGKKFWESLLNLATAIDSCEISYGVLVVCPNSSGTIRDQLARDVIRMGQGRQDALSSTGRQLKEHLSSKALDVERVCAGLRIVTVHALETDSASVSAARAELAHLCTDVQGAWACLYLDAYRLIERLGRKTAVTILQLLRSASIELRVDAINSPVALLQKLSAWVAGANDRFSVFGIPKALPLETSWIDLKATVQKEDQVNDDSLANALERYHSWGSRSNSRDAKEIDAETLGQFVKRCVVVAGPGMGKTILLKQLARIYAKTGHPVLRVSLKTVAARIETSGQGVEESILDLGLDGSGLDAKDLHRVNLQNVVFLCDGLDECGHLQAEVAQGLMNLAEGYPHCRIISTTRPIGYDTSLLRIWRHYELLPLNPYGAKQHISKLLRGVLDEESQKFKNTLTFAEAQLDLSHVKMMASRSPMLLGFIASLSLKSVSAGASRSDLYRQLFKLIEDAPSSRSGDRNIGSALMVGFLEILGWNLLAYPYETLTNTLQRCAQDIAPELGQSLLRAEDTCHRCARRWEDLGMLEQVCFQSDKGITFVHKTFGEYAAARRLAKLDPLQQDAILRSHVADGAWAETIKFACSMGLAERAISSTLAKIENDDLRADILERAFEYLNESPEQVQEMVTNILFKKAWECALSPYRLQALRAGLELAKVAPKYSTVSSRASRELTHHQPWTKLTAWACVCGAGPEYFNYHDLLNMLKEIPSTGYRFKRLLARGLILGDPMTELVESFVLSAAHEILRHGPDPKDLAVLQTVLDQEFGQTTSFYSAIAELLKPHGWHPRKNHLASVRNLYLTPKYWKNWRNEYIALLEALDVPSVKVNIDEQPADDSVLMYLSGFINASHYWRISAGHVLKWHSEKEADTANEVLQAFAAISGVGRDGLTSDVRLLLAMLKAETDDAMAIDYIHGRLVQVDTSPNWERAKQVSILLEKLEQGVLHRSEWIVMLAANLLVNKASKEQLYPIIERLLNEGIGKALWATAQLTKELESSDAIDLIRKRLLKPMSKGCEYIFKTLGELSSAFEDSETLQALRNGLICKYPKVAIEAAKVARKVAVTLQADLKGTLWESYRYWQVNEEPYPTSDGIIPNSPRADLVKVILTVADVEDAELINMAADPRSDVREASNQALLDRLVQSEDFRDKFLAAVLEEKLTLFLLDEALKNEAPFSSRQCLTIRDMLDDEDPKKRYAAMMVLSAPYSTAEVTQRYVQRLLGDEEEDIRERAHEILRCCGASKI